MKLSIGELAVLIEHIEHTPYRPLPSGLVRIQKRLEANKQKKLKKLLGQTLRS